MAKSRAMSLIELVIALTMVGLLLAVAFGAHWFFSGNFIEASSRMNANLQTEFALQQIKMHLTSAIDLDSFFPAGVTSTKTELGFTGESDVMVITPDDLTDNRHYRLYVPASGDHAGALILEYAVGGVTKYRTLLESRLQPTIEFRYDAGTEPNFITVTIQVSTKRTTITKTEGVQFWFISIVQ